MSIDGTKKLGDWGKMTPVSESGGKHITQTNENANDGRGAHVTSQVGGEVSVRDHFDENGDHKGTTYGK